MQTVEYVSPPSNPEPEEGMTLMMVKELSSPQQQSSRQIIQGVLGGLEPEGTELNILSIETEEEITIT